MRISDWSSDVCSSDLGESPARVGTIRPISPPRRGPESQPVSLAALGSCLRRSTFSPRRHRLLDRPEDRATMIVLGPDPHRIARLEEAGGGLAVADRLEIGRAHV